MLRAPRTDIGGLVYHVLNRANARAPLFEDQADYRSFWHLVLWPHADGDLGRFVRRLTQRHIQALAPLS
jgi:putative transposase